MANLDKVLEDFLCSSYSKLIHNEERILKVLGDITLKELRTLEVIKTCENRDNNTSSTVARLLGISAGTLTTNIDRLSKKGLVVRTKKEGDLRTNLLALTLKGEKVLKSYNDEHRKLITNGLSKLTSTEKATIVSLVSKLEI